MTLHRDSLRHMLDRLYHRFNSRRWVHPDPLEFLYRYTDQPDREIAGLIASGLAYGRVASILKGVDTVLAPLGEHPAETVREMGSSALVELYGDFRYRFTTGREIASILSAAATLHSQEGTMGAFFSSLLDRSTFRQACDNFVGRLLRLSGGSDSTLLPLPSRGSACKRLNLLLRWMVRSDEVDPGGWQDVDPEVLRVPLDVHMHRAGRLLGFTTRSCGDWRTVEEITAGFRELCPEDPVRYDFALTRFGIRQEMGPEELEEELERATLPEGSQA